MEPINPPEGHFSRIYLHYSAGFTWDSKRTSIKLTLDKENLICSVKEGTGFKSTLGNYVFTPGDKYYFEIYINKGQLIKIGIARP
jgi:hypothetical protein